MITNDQAAKINREVRQWSNQSRDLLENRVRMLTNKNKHTFLFGALRGYGKGATSKITTGKLADSIRDKTLQRFGIVERIVFPFAKHGYFIAVGASRGHAAKSNPRAKIDWYNFLFEQRLQSLADIYAENFADVAIQSYELTVKEK